MVAGKGRGQAMAVLIFASFMDLLDVTIVQVALPAIRNDLGASEAELEWIVSGYMLAFAVLLITGGRIGDRIGHRRAFLIGVAGFTVASVAAGLAPSGDVLVGSRVVQGGFAAFMVPQMLATLQSLFAPRERAPVLGVVGAVSGVAAVLGPVLGGWLVTVDLWGMGWRSIFLLNLVVGVVIFIAALLVVPETRSPHPHRMDLPGVGLLTVGLLLIFVPLIEGRSLGWPVWLLPIAAAGVGVLAVFVMHERQRDRTDGSAVLPMRLFADRGFSAGVVTQASFQGAMNAFTLVYVIYIQSFLGFDALHAGLTLLPLSLGALIGTGIAVPLGTRVGKLIVTAGALIQAGAIGWVFMTVIGSGGAFTGWELVVPLTFAGVGLGLLIVPLTDIALSGVNVSDAGAASGALSTFQQLGAATGVAVSATVFFGIIGINPTHAVALDGLAGAGSIAVGGYLLAAAASLLLPVRTTVRAHMAQVELAMRD